MKNHTDFIRLFLSIGVLAFFVGCNQAPATKSSKESSIEVAQKTDTASIDIPPIDLAAPAEFETATFGLG